MNKRLAALRRRHFGQRSERLADQLELQIEQMEQILERTAAPTGQPVRPVRKPLPASLPREEEVLAPPYALCPGCGVELRRIGEDVSEVLEIVPARLRVRRYVRPVMACRCCGDISQAAPPPLPIPKSNAAPSLLADIALAKYDDHLPAYRQAERFARGRQLPRSTLSAWLGRTAALLEPLTDAVAAHVFQAAKGPAAKDVLDRIGQLYAVEDKVRGKPPDQRAAVRKAEAAPLIADLRTVLDDLLSKVSGKSPLAGAIRYAVTRWTELTRDLEDGRLEIDNNIAERAMRTIAIARPFCPCRAGC